MIRIILLLLFLPCCLFAKTLGSEFERAEAGDYVLFSEQKHLILLRIQEKKEHLLTVEEVTTDNPEIKAESVQSWIDNGAPGATSWTVSTIDLKDGRVVSIYSVMTNEWQKEDPVLSFFPTLLRLSLSSVPEERRKKIGPAPMAGEHDLRKFWYPKAVVNSKPIETTFHVFSAQWPKDGSDLSEKMIILYIPRAKETLSYFPYWIEVQGLFGKAKFRVIDSGKGMNTSVVNSPSS